MVGCIEEVSHNAIAVYWNPLESQAKVSLLDIFMYFFTVIIIYNIYVLYYGHINYVTYNVTRTRLSHTQVCYCTVLI